MSPPLIRMPKPAAIPVQTMTAVGVARPSAQGQAITIVDTPNVNANPNLLSCVLTKLSGLVYTAMNHETQAITAHKIMNGTKIDEILSAYA
mmetsp:Transcript_4049/g.4961  ORF Transcript_4049/g.4961 Transcript_4049/m.4961 type:complete len:91 (+) Transcript_4049:221-493(+)